VILFGSNLRGFKNREGLGNNRSENADTDSFYRPFPKGMFRLNEKFLDVNPDNYFISEITLAELMFGVENSEKKEKNQTALDDFLS
jgi:predicted nucleic acid-binding protein